MEHLEFRCGSVQYVAWIAQESWENARDSLQNAAALHEEGDTRFRWSARFLANYPRARVRLVVEDVRLYGDPDATRGVSDTLPAPLLMAILTFRGALEELDETERVGCDPDEYGDILDLWRKGDDVDILSYDTGEHALFNGQSLLADVRAVERQAKAYVAERLPELRQHPELGAWFRGETDRLPWQ